MLPDAADEGARRAALAHWITDADNMLDVALHRQSRLAVSLRRGPRGFAQRFRTHGLQPSHPELLDWLAVRFRDEGGSFKQLHKLILMSATYRQSSQPTATMRRKIDADNRYLWRMNRQRLDAESVRDSVLAVAANSI